MDDHTSELQTKRAAYDAAHDEDERTRRELHAAIVDALGDGMRQVDVVKATGYTRERIRLIAERARRDM